MIPAILDKKIIIEKETTTINRVNTPKKTYEFYKECHANLYTPSGGTQYTEEGQLVLSNDLFTIRYDREVNLKCRVIYNNNYYKIEHIEEVGRKHWMKSQCIVWDRATNY